jgi:GTPase involved in cell partitioning and DNA repair
LRCSIFIGDFFFCRGLITFCLYSSPGCKRASGGSGGKGGNVYIIADPEVNSLNFRTIHFNAENGAHGGGNGMTGRNGKDVYIKVPLGTIVRRKLDWANFSQEDYEKFGGELEEDQGQSIDDLNTVFLVAEGGKPGVGNKIVAAKTSSKTKSMVGCMFVFVTIYDSFCIALI